MTTVILVLAIVALVIIGLLLWLQMHTNAARESSIMGQLRAEVEARRAAEDRARSMETTVTHVDKTMDDAMSIMRQANVFAQQVSRNRDSLTNDIAILGHIVGERLLLEGVGDETRAIWHIDQALGLNDEEVKKMVVAGYRSTFEGIDADPDDYRPLNDTTAAALKRTDKAVDSISDPQESERRESF